MNISDDWLEDLRKGNREDLMDRLDALIAAAGESAGADEQRTLLLDLQAHQVELQIQSRELRQVQAELEASRDHFARLFDLAPVGYVIFDGRGSIRDVNLAAASLLRRTRFQLEKAPFVGYLAEGESGAFFRHLKSVLSGDGSPRRPEPLDLRLRRPGECWVRLLTIRLDGEAGPECFAAIMDITEETRAKRRLEESDRFRQAVLDALPAQVAVLDRDGRILAVNRSWQRFAEEGGAGEALHRGIGVDYFAACLRASGPEREDGRRAAEGIRAVLDGRRSEHSQEYPCPAGEDERWFLLKVSPLEGDGEGAVVVHLDVTERKLAEDRARRAREAMAQVARVNAVGILASSLIHELTQPLSAASFFSGAAVSLAERGGDDPARLAEVLHSVDGQIRRAGDILQRLREFLRRREMRMTEVPVDRMVERGIALVAWFAADRRVDLRFTPPPVAPRVTADALQIEQVVINLLCNSVQAIDAAQSPRREATVELRERDGEVEITVRDSGPGLSPDMAEGLFDIFSTTREAGLGMGLAISRDIVEAHGGRIWFEAEPEAGAVCHFTLPLAGQESGA